MNNLTHIKHQRSVNGYVWQKRDFCYILKQKIIDKLGVSDVIAQMLSGKFSDLLEVENYVEATLKKNMKDPFILKDMKEGVEFVINAILANKKIVIFADYDVDGATSAAIFKNYFKSFGKKIEIYIPDRINEGYGPNSKALLQLKNNGADLVITVDCGTTSFEPLSKAKKAGLDVIVIDHHQGASKTPDALAIINPNRIDESGEYKYLCAAGVSFLFVVALNNCLQQRDFFAGQNKPNLLELLELVAIGTVCDVVPLKELNRAFVKQGLKFLRKSQRPGLRALAAVSNYDLMQSESYHLGFIIGPRINAGGRVALAGLGSELLTTDDYDQAYKIALKLELHNKERKAIEAQVLEEAMSQVEEKELYKKSVIVIYAENWHPGVIGIVASRVKDKYKLPVAVIALNNGMGKASCRSIVGVNFGAAIASCKLEGLLIDGGGHEMAAGFSIKEEKIEIFTDYLDKLMVDSVKESLKDKVKKYDYSLSVSAFSLDFLSELKILPPYGMENIEPKFVIRNCKVFNLKQIGANHYKCRLVESSSGIYGKSIDAVIWKAKETIMGENLLNLKTEPISVLGRVKINTWQGKETPQFEIDDIMFGV